MSDLHALEDALDREAWLLWRKGGIGGSDAAIIMGEARWGSPWTLYLEKKRGLTSRADAGAMLTGKLLEAAIIEWARQEVGAEWAKTPGHRPHTDYPWIRGTPDSLLGGGSIADPIGVEAKVSDAWGWEAVPDYYLWQVRIYMAIYDKPFWLVAVFFRKVPSWKLFRVERDLDIEAEMIGTIGAWWAKYIVGNEIPAIDETPAAGRGLGILHGAPSERDSFRVATDAEEVLARTYADTRDAVDELEGVRDLLANQLRDTIGGNAGIRFTGGRVRWSRSEKRPRGSLTVRIDEE